MRVIKILLILGLCAGLLPSPAGGQSKVRRPLVEDRVPQDYIEAVRRYRLAAEQGHAVAQFELGYAYATGVGVSQDYAKAARWYRLAAEQGNAKAQFELGNMYHEGKGVLQDFAEAVRWYRLAAEQGNAKAQGDLGLMYHEGYGVPKDYVFAYMWYNLASANGDRFAREVRNELLKEMTPQNIAEAQRMAREWLEKRKGKR